MTNKLKTKIYKNMLLMSVIFILLSACILMVVTYNNVERQIMDSNRADAEYIGFFIEKYGLKSIEDIKVSEDRRITVIDAYGTVIYDSCMTAEKMENHLERPEIQNAFKIGKGEAKRVSDTLSETSYYYAIMLGDGNILRLATTSATVYNTFISAVPHILLMSVITLILAFLLSHYMTEKIVKPINHIDTSKPEDIEVYDELAPFVSKIRHQNQVIDSQMKDLRRKKIEFETITENMNEGLIIIGKNGNIISYNRSAKRLLNVNSLHNDLTNILMFNRNSKFEEMANKALSGEAGYLRLPIDERVCEIMATPVMDGEKQKGTVILIIDITEKEKRESLRREFSANVSHELKTPLTSISGYAEIMKTGIVKKEDMINFAEIIYNEAQRLINLVGDIIKVSKLDEEDVHLDAADINIKELVENIAERLKEEADKRNVEITVLENENVKSSNHEKNKEYTLNSYPQIVDEIIYNIMENAIKYNRDGGKAEVRIEDTTEKIIVAIKDTGIGIPKEDIGRVFERFYRADKSHSKAVGGTGLGLSIVKHGAAFIGAEVDMESEKDVGTLVTITFYKYSFSNIHFIEKNN